MGQNIISIQCKDFDDMRKFLYKYNQLPENWISVGYTLVEDANIIFLTHKKQMDFIISKLEEQGFNFDLATATGIEFCVEKILSEQKNSFFPNFNSFYLIASLSLENIFKGLLLGYNPSFLNFEKCPKIIKTHDLM